MYVCMYVCMYVMPTKHEDVDENNYKTDHRTCCYEYLKIYMKLGFISS